MKLTKHFDAFLVNKVNLSDTRIQRLDKRVKMIEDFVSDGEDEFANSFIDLIPQGSYAHRTIINPVGADDFDADVLLHLDEVDNWKPEDYVEELYRKFRASSTYRDMVSRHDRCVKVDYADDFHVDVVPYLTRYGKNYITNHVEERFELTNPEGYNAWLDGRNRLTHGRLVKVIRLMKYLRDSKDTFSVKSVILSILMGNRVKDSAAWGDEGDYPDVPTSLKTLIGDLDDFLQANPMMPSIDDPSEPTENFNHRWDQDQYANFRTRIHTYREWIDDAYDDTEVESSKTKWRRLFGEKFGTYDTNVAKATNAHVGVQGVSDTNEEIAEKFTIGLRSDARIKIGARARTRKGFRTYELSTKGNIVSPGRTVDFRIVKNTVSEPHELYWKVRNTGAEAMKADAVRGQIVKDSGSRTKSEPTKYFGRHYVEVYVIVNGVCVAMDHQDVIIK